MDELLTTIGSRIRTAREGLGLSQEALAARARLNTSYLSQIERGRKAPSLEVLSRLATAVRLPLGVLFAEDETVDSRDLQFKEIEALVDAMPSDKRPALLTLIRSLTELAAD
jgi:transcriptional regulator with XRE-family HTH domain